MQITNTSNSEKHFCIVYYNYREHMGHEKRRCFMIGEKKEKRKNALYSIIALLLGIAMCVAGVYGIVSRGIASKEYKNTTDKRDVVAIVESCKEVDISDKDDYKRTFEYRVKYHCEIDGKTYRGRKTYNHRVSPGEEIEVEVYKTSKGNYKLKSESDPIEFLYCCIAIPLGLLIAVATVWSMFGKNSNKEKNNN